MRNDRGLLAAYASERSEGAFSELVEHYAGLVYSTALRVGGGDEALAKDVAQQVFIDLARKARAVRRQSVPLGGWLYRHTFFTATKAIRTERRRRARELEVASMSTTDTQTHPAAAGLAGVLDQAMNRLSVQDRDVLVLRFFQQQDLKAVGAALGLSEDAAQKRVARAVERLRVIFARRGVVVSTAVLTSSLAGTVPIPVPAGFVTLASTAALASAAGAGGLSVFSLLPVSPSPAGIALAAAIGCLGVVGLLEHRTCSTLRQTKQLLTQQEAVVAGLRAENSRLLAIREDSAALDRLQRDQLDLARLRATVARMRVEPETNAAAGLSALAGGPVGEPKAQWVVDARGRGSVVGALSMALRSAEEDLSRSATYALAWLGATDPDAIAVLRQRAKECSLAEDDDYRRSLPVRVTDAIRRICPDNLTPWERENPAYGMDYVADLRFFESDRAEPTVE